MARLKSVLMRGAALGLLIVPLAACDTWFGEEEAPPLPGTRLEVLSLDRSLEPDFAISDLTVRLPPPEPMTNWPQAGGFPNHALYHVALGSDNPDEVWSRNIGYGSSDDSEQLLSQPIIFNGKVYTIDAVATVTAFDAVTGDWLWENELKPDNEEGGVLGAGIAYDGGVIFAATGFAELAALDSDSGEVIWRTRLSAPMRSAPTVVNGRVFVITVDNQTFAVDARNGESIWTHRGITEGAAFLGAASPAVDGDLVVTAYSSGELVGLRAGSGREVWSDSLSSARRTDAVSAIADIRGRPVIDRDLVIATSNAGLTVGIDVRTGTRLWEVDAGGIHGPWTAGDFVYLLTNNNDLLCIRRRSGEIRWITPLPRFGNPEDRLDPIQWVGPTLVDDRLLVASDQGMIYSVSPYDGRVVGQLEMSDGITLPPSIAGDTLYFLTEDADLIAFR